MGRKRRQAAAPKKKGGLMMGIRGGVQKAARKVGVGEEKAATAAPNARRKALFWNVVTGILVIVTGVILLRRFGVIHF